MLLCKPMTVSAHTIKEATLRELVRVNSVRSATARGVRGGFAIVIACESTELTLASVRGEIRLFTLGHASKFLYSLGLMRFQVDMTAFQEGLMRNARPDRAEALRGTVTKLRQQMLI
jgi:hypothetical protein